MLRHPAVVIVPYQVSTISFFEFYRRNVPLFVPSLRLLTQWVLRHNLMWERVYGRPSRQKHERHDAMVQPSSQGLVTPS